MCNNLCFNCACLGDCPRQTSDTSFCLYFTRSKINGRMIAQLACVNKCTVFKYPQRYFRESYVRKLFEPLGYTVIVEQENGKAIYYVKKKFADRQAEVDALNNMEWDEDLGELEDIDNNGEDN